MLSTGFIIAVLFIVFRIVIPAKKDVITSISSSDYLKGFFLTFPLWLLSSAAFAGLFYLVLAKVPALFSSDYLYNLYPDQNFWLLVASGLGLGFGLLTIFRWLDIILKDKAAAFWAKYNQTYGFQGDYVLKGFALLLIGAGIVFVLLGKNAAFEIYEDKIEVSRLFELSSKTYPITDIQSISYKEIYVAPEGNKVFKPHYELLFSDGFRWHSVMDLREPKETDDAVFEELSKAIGKEIVDK